MDTYGAKSFFPSIRFSVLTFALSELQFRSSGYGGGSWRRGRGASDESTDEEKQRTWDIFRGRRRRRAKE